MDKRFEALEMIMREIKTELKADIEKLGRSLKADIERVERSLKADITLVERWVITLYGLFVRPLQSWQ